jgi:hypothetical protein
MLITFVVMFFYEPKGSYFEVILNAKIPRTKKNVTRRKRIRSLE